MCCFAFHLVFSICNKIGRIVLKCQPGTLERRIMPMDRISLMSDFVSIVAERNHFLLHSSLIRLCRGGWFLCLAVFEWWVLKISLFPWMESLVNRPSNAALSAFLSVLLLRYACFLVQMVLTWHHWHYTQGLLSTLNPESDVVFVVGLWLYSLVSWSHVDFVLFGGFVCHLFDGLQQLVRSHVSDASLRYAPFDRCVDMTSQSLLLVLNIC